MNLEKQNHVINFPNLWTKILSKTKSEGDCLIFTGSGYNSGYGKTSVGFKKKVGVHQASFLLHHGAYPENHLILHSCDNKRCVNPDHLRSGTQLDNMREMDKKGRRVSKPRGLDDFSALLIKRMDLAKFCSRRVMAERFGVSYALIGKVLRGGYKSHGVRNYDVFTEVPKA